MQEKTRPLILRYHGRELLFDWMAQQVSEAIYQNRDVTPYPDFLQQRLADGKVSHTLEDHDLSLTPYTYQLVLGPGREHTQAYLDSYRAGTPIPPVQYYRKVAAKDKPSELLSRDQLTAFNTLIS